MTTKRLTDAEFEEACDETFPIALEQEARRARAREAELEAQLDAITDIVLATFWNTTQEST